MSTLPVVPNVIKVSLNWNIEADPMGMTVHHFSYTGGPPSAANCATMASSITASAQSAFASVTSTHVGVQSARVTDLSSMSGGDATAGTPWLGTRTGGLLPPGVAAVIAHSIARRYRGGKPRSYMPFGVATDPATTGFWLSASVTAFDNAWGAWVSDVEGNGAGCVITNLVNVSYYSGYTLGPAGPGGYRKKIPTPRAVPIVDPVLGHTTSVLFGSQRRRNRNQ